MQRSDKKSKRGMRVKEGQGKQRRRDKARGGEIRSVRRVKEGKGQ